MGRDLRAGAVARFALRRYPEAAQAWERVRREVPEFEPIYFSLADAYGLQHEEATALKVLREAERRWPADAEVANAIGVIQIRRGALDAAIESFQRATTTAPAESSATSTSRAPTRCACSSRSATTARCRSGFGGDEDRARHRELPKYAAARRTLYVTPRRRRRVNALSAGVS
mgnify:CR=1 FL=1